MKRGVPQRALMIPRSVLFHCVSSPVYEVKRLSQALCLPLGLIGCSPSLSPGLLSSKHTASDPVSLQTKKDSHTQSVQYLLYHIHTAGILAVLRVHVCTSAPSGLCGLLTALQKP